MLSGGPDNERLEFLGDAVLELAVSHLLFKMADQRDEGGLTQLRSLLVRQAPLARIAMRLFSEKPKAFRHRMEMLWEHAR